MAFVDCIALSISFAMLLLPFAGVALLVDEGAEE